MTTLRSRYWPERTISVPFTEDEELQIASFGKCEQARMVGRLPLLLQQLQLRVGLRCRLTDRASELIGRHTRRAGSGGEDAARGERFQRGAVQRGIALERGGHRSLRLRNAGGSSTIRSKGSWSPRRNSRTSAATNRCLAGSIPFSSKLRRASRMAAASRSIETTSRAPPRTALTENPPE